MATRVPPTECPPLPTRKQWTDWVDAQRAINPLFLAPEQVCQEDISEWEEATHKLEEVKAREIKLRGKIFKGLFTSPREGANNVKLADGTILNATHKIARDVDDEGLALLTVLKVVDARQQLTSLGVDHSQMPDDMFVTQALGIKMPELVKFKPELVTSKYRELSKEQSAVFDRCLVVKDATPSLKLRLPTSTE